MKLTYLALATCMAAVFCLDALAAPEIKEPTEIGTTKSLSPGQYSLTSKSTSKTFDLMVTGKGVMILSPKGAGAAPTATTAAPAAAAATATAGAAAAGAGAAADAQTAAAPKNSALKGLFQQGMQKGLQELKRPGTKRTIEKLIK